jgi:curved DNA-binding protein CbpA
VTYYELLGVPPSASPNEVRAAYRRAIRRYHPDVNRAPDALRLTTMLNEAWGTLADPTSRAAYDRRIGLGAPTFQPYVRRRPATSYARRPDTPYARRPDAPYARRPDTYEYRHAPYEATVVETRSSAMPIFRLAAGGLRVLLLVAFIASVIHWFPLVTAICVGIFIARAAGRTCR